MEKPPFQLRVNAVSAVMTGAALVFAVLQGWVFALGCLLLFGITLGFSAIVARIAFPSWYRALDRIQQQERVKNKRKNTPPNA